MTDDEVEVLYFARAVAFGMYVCDDPGHADDFLAVMCNDLPEYADFYLDVVNEARRLHAEWYAAGEITDEVAARIVYRTGA
jgi:hypothetical protein